MASASGFLCARVCVFSSWNTSALATFSCCDVVLCCGFIPRVYPLRAVHPVLEFSHCGDVPSSSSCVQPLPGGMNLDLIHCLRLCALGFSHCCGLRALGLHPLLQAAYARVHPLCALESILPSSATAAGDVPSKFVHCCGPVPLQSHCSAARPTG